MTGKNKIRPTEWKKPDEARSKIMRSVKTKNTSVELVVRQSLRAMGFHYRLHAKGLPGTPDIVFRKNKKAIFVNGCFWHGHYCNKGRRPKTNVDFWRNKIEQNKRRDEKKVDDLRALQWKVLTVWQCEVEDLKNLKKILLDFLNDTE